jgi:hypothetical protein
VSNLLPATTERKGCSALKSLSRFFIYFCIKNPAYEGRYLLIPTVEA